MFDLEPLARFPLVHVDGDALEPDPALALPYLDEHDFVLAQAQQRAPWDRERARLVYRDLYGGIHFGTQQFVGIVEGAAHLCRARARVEHSAHPVDLALEDLA